MFGEIAKGFENIFIRTQYRLADHGREYAFWEIKRYANEEDRLAKKEYSKDEAKELFGVPQTTQIPYNLLLNEGINVLWTLVCGTGGTKFDNSNSYIGIGDSTAAEAATQTGLQATTNKAYKGMDTSYPTYGTNQYATWKATFGSTEGNFAWNEFTIANGNSDSATNLNRRVSAQGLKSAGQTWEITLQITIS